MAKFRKKPVVIEAVKFVYEAQILTLEDGQYLQVAHIATEGDWIIKVIQGEFYACKPDIFEATYEEVRDD